MAIGNYFLIAVLYFGNRSISFHFINFSFRHIQVIDNLYI